MPAATAGQEVHGMARATRKKSSSRKKSTRKATGTSPRFRDRSGKRVPPKWREGYAKHAVFDDAAKQVYLDFLAKTGRRYDSAAAAGVTPKTVMRHVDSDPEFAEAREDAIAAWRDRVLKQAEKVAITGTLEPIASGGKLVGNKRVFATNILAMEMRRVEPSYKERHEHDVNVNGGVLVAPAGQSPDEWSKQFARATPDSGGPE